LGLPNFFRITIEFSPPLLLLSSSLSLEIPAGEIKQIRW
jgi:hypothetical protein